MKKDLIKNEDKKIEILKEIITLMLSYNEGQLSVDKKINFGLNHLKIQYKMYGEDDGQEFSDNYFLNKTVPYYDIKFKESNDGEYTKVTTTFILKNEDKKSMYNSLKINLEKISLALINHRGVEVFRNKKELNQEELNKILINFVESEKNDDILFNEFKTYLNHIMCKDINLLNKKIEELILIKKNEINDKIISEKIKENNKILNSYDCGLSF